MAQQDVYLSV